MPGQDERPVLTPDRSATVEVLPPAESQAMVAAKPTNLSSAMTGPAVASLAMVDDGLVVIERMAAIVENARLAAIRMTCPEDWVLNKDQQSVEVAMLTASGAQKIASLYGIALEPVPPAKTLEPTKTEINGKTAFTLQWRATSRLLNRTVDGESTRREDEKFTGRAVDDVGDFSFEAKALSYEPDLKKATRTLSMTSAVRELVGLKNVSRDELTTCWKGTEKKTEKCRMGHGYGTSNNRNAEGVAEGDVAADAEKLRVEILRRVSGDEREAKKLLEQITINNEGKFAKTSTKQFTQAWMVEAAWKRLRVHPVFGDGKQQAQQREPGEDE